MAKVFLGTLSGLLITPIALFLAIASGAAGHGNYIFARLFFPYSMLLTLIQNDTITLPLVLLALVQFPLCGAVIGFAAAKKHTLYAVGPLLVAHSVAAGFCFAGVIPNFSGS
jgi:hypothetical protein